MIYVQRHLALPLFSRMDHDGGVTVANIVPTVSSRHKHAFINVTLVYHIHADVLNLADASFVVPIAIAI